MAFHFCYELAYNLIAQRDLEKSGLNLLYSNGMLQIYYSVAHSLYNASIVDPIMVLNAGSDDLYRLSLQDIEILCRFCDHELYLRNEAQNNQILIADAKPGDVTDLIHSRLGHFNLSPILHAYRLGRLGGLDNYINQIKDNHFCSFCAMGKITIQPFRGVHKFENYRYGEYIYSDVCGPFRVKSRGGMRYFVSYIDGLTRECYIGFMATKDEQLGCFQTYLEHYLRPRNTTVKVIFSDNGGEYISNEFISYCHANGIKPIRSSPYSPQQNGIAERYNRTIIEAVRTMLLESGLPPSFWAEAVNTANDVKNLLPHAAFNNNITPFELVHGVVPDLSHLRVFGCDCYVLDNDSNKSKLSPKGLPGTFLGYSKSSQSYRAMLWTSKKVVVSRNVIFNELNNSRSNPRLQQLVNPFVWRSAQQEGIVNDMLNSRLDTMCGNDEEESIEEVAANGNMFVKQRDEDVSSLGKTRPQRITMAPDRLHYSQLGGVNIANSHYGEKFIQPHGPSLEDMMEVEMANAVTSTERVAPRTYQDAVTTVDSEMWIQSILTEYRRLDERDTWDIVDNTGNRFYEIDTTWVFRYKEAEDGSILSYKARLCVKGFRQVEGIDYFDTFSPVARKESIRMFLSIVCQHDLICHQIDVDSAFPYADLHEDVYIKAPDGMYLQEHQCLKLKKALYGLKQSPRAWNIHLTNVLNTLGFVKAESDHCIFLRKTGDDICMLSVYVDDMLIASKSLDDITHIKECLQDHFSIKDLGEAKHILGIRISRSICEGWLCLSMPTHILKMLNRFSIFMEDPMAVEESPMKEGLQLNDIEDNDDIMDNIPFREAVGSAMYPITCCHPEAQYAIGLISRFVSHPSMQHWSALLHLLRYLRGAADKGVCYYRQSGPMANILYAYADADWASSDLVNRRSVTGYLMYLNGGVISWSSTVQKSVAKSTVEAEYYALSAASDEIMFLRTLLDELGFTQAQPTIIHEDNKGTRDLAMNPVFHKRTKHIEIRYHSIRERVEQGHVRVNLVESKNNIADLLTKATSVKLFKLNVNQVVTDPSSVCLQMFCY